MPAVSFLFAALPPEFETMEMSALPLYGVIGQCCIRKSRSFAPALKTGLLDHEKRFAPRCFFAGGAGGLRKQTVATRSQISYGDFS
jgi:hypothetical protein